MNTVNWVIFVVLVAFYCTQLLPIHLDWIEQSRLVCDIESKNGPYDSLILTLKNTSSNYEHCSSDITELESLHTKGAVFLNINKDMLAVVSRLNGFNFHRHYNNLYTYYKWNLDGVEDKVPAHSTSVEGVNGIVLSPDEQSVLLVYEYGNWKGVSGALNRGEMMTECLEREINEEVGVELDSSFETMWVGGWHDHSYGEARVNDNFHTMVVKSKSLEFQVDGFEIKKAQWVSIDELVGLREYKIDGEKVCEYLLHWIQMYKQNKSRRIIKVNDHLELV